MAGDTAFGLRREAIGLREVLFQSITAMAPAAAVAASIPSGAAFAGGSLPLSVLVALVACLFTASCVAELARRLPAAGSVATYAAQGLHPAVGFLVGADGPHARHGGRGTGQPGGALRAGAGRARREHGHP
ncbi:hypothetical protein AB0N14_38835 [Streptomyces sp. NPDC051104]|uniref:hypothetical protein n=1 Tax=Streptomyces sp. NPDC051104 TaxID=3155044 RepID=UPI00341AC254